MEFPSSPTNGQLFTNFGKVYEYSISKTAWFPISTTLSITDIVGVDETINPQVGDVIISDGNLLTTGTLNPVNVYQFISQLPLSGNDAGTLASVSENNRLYIWTGAGWFSVALVNTSPTITTGPDATYQLNIDGTPTVITLAATDPEEVPITWSYSVTSGSLEDTVITNDGPEFTITPGLIAATFDLTFTASDGINLAQTPVSSFTLLFVGDWATATRLHTLNDPNAYGTSFLDQFGYSSAISSNYAIVGCRFEDDAGGLQSGKAYIFNTTTGALLHTLDNPNSGSGANEYFGSSVGVFGNYAVVGAPGTTLGGKVCVFNATTGALLRTIINPDPDSNASGDNFGFSLGISGDYIIVGASGEDTTGESTTATNSGIAYIFNVATGALVHTLINPSNGPVGTAANDGFGAAVAISGNYAIVGAYGEDGYDAADSGIAYIFNVATGALVYTLDNPNAYGTGTSDYFGESVAISGNYAIVGVRAEDDATGLSSGKAYIFNVTTGASLHTLNNPTPSANDEFGQSVGISGDFAVVGALYDDAGGEDAGRAYIFDVTTGLLVKTLVNPTAVGSSANDRFGSSVAISGNYCIVTAPTEDFDEAASGTAYIFKAG
jgi:hypothetical protein